MSILARFADATYRAGPPAQAVRFWLWWMGELASCIPGPVLDWLADPDGTLIIQPEGSRFSVTMGGMSRPTILDPATLPSFLKEALQNASSIVLLLPKGTVLRRMIDIPNEAMIDINTAMPFLVERHTPFMRGNASFAYRIIGPKTKRLTAVEVAATSRAALEQIEESLFSLGVRLTSIRVSGDTTQPTLEFKKVGSSRRGYPWQRPGMIIAYAATIVLFLGPLGVASLAHARLMRERAQVESYQIDETAIQTAKRSLEQQISKFVFFQKLASRPKALEIIKSLTDALPDSAWLFRLDMDEHTVRIGGYARDVPTVVQRMEALPWVHTVEFQSPVVHDLSRQDDRFEMLIQIKSDVL